MIRTTIILLGYLLLSISASAQTAKPSVSGTGIIYSRETAVNLKMHTTRGFVLGVEKGRLRTYYKTTFYHLSLGEIKHPKEYRQPADPSQRKAYRPYVFGKQNNLFVLRGGWGVKRYFTEKARYKGVALGMSYTFGPSLGMLKPYYLALRRPGIDNPGFSRVAHEKYSEDNANIFLNNTQILGASPFTRGLSEMNFLPGANGSIAFHMDWGAFDEFLRALEIGAMLDVFPKRAPILVSEQNSPFFLNFFVNLQFGKRK